MLKTTIFLLIFHIGINDSARILGLFPMQGRSHFIMFEALMKGLVEKGHEVDVLSHFPQKQSIPRYNDISVKGSLPGLVNNLSYAIVQELSLNNILAFIFTETGTRLCESVLFSPAVQKIKNSNARYDVIVTETFGTDCFLGFGHHFKAPMIGMVSSVVLPWNNDRFGNPDNPSYIPNYFMPYTNNMTMFQRLINTAILVYTKLRYYLDATLPSEAYTKQFFGNDYPALDKLSKNMSMLFVNSHISINGARPFAPNVIEVGGLHVRPPKPLTGDLSEIMNASKNGVIYFSLGSLVQSETLPPNTIRALLDALGQMPYTVLWKADPDKLPQPIPSNIKLALWMPQMDILCHPNTKVFITHGGMMGTQEAVYCGVPLIGIPLFADQVFNIRNYAQRGTALSLDINDITKDTMQNALKEIINNARYKSNAMKLSSLFRDRPLSAMETAIYWVEYVIKYKGAPQLRPVGADLEWYQYYLIDVLCVVFISITFIIYCIYFILNIFIRCKRTKQTRKQKTH